MYVYKTGKGTAAGSVTKLLLDPRNFVYTKHSESNKCKEGVRAFWRCIKRNTCKVKCSTLNDELSEIRGFHNHDPTFCENTMFIFKEESSQSSQEGYNPHI